jgi:feruloyl-CoA synthase
VGAWETLRYAQAAERSRRVGAALRALGATPERPVLLLSGNGIDHALVTFGALRAGIPVVPVCAGVALSAADEYAQLRAIAALVRPGVVFARDGAMYAPAARAVAPDAAYVSVTPAAGMRGVDYASLLAHPPLLKSAPIGSETVAKILIGWHESGEPRGVVTTHGMLCAMLQGITQAWPFLADRPPVVVDGLPWSRGFGGNAVLGIVLRHAGTLYIEGGPGTLRAQVAPTLAFDVPLGWTRWVARLRADDALRRRWLSRLERALWEGAPLAPATHDALRAIGVPLGAGWGATETGPVIALTRDDDVAPDAVGRPLAGVELKLIPSGELYEARVRGPQVTPGYFWRPDLTAAAFDEEGFYRLGDLVRPLDAREPQRGLAFVGRIDERFKLSSGTWVSAAELRAAFLAQSAPDLADAIVTGEGRDVVGVLVWPSAEGELLERDVLRAQIAGAMRRAASGSGFAEKMRRALIVRGAPPRGERGEIVARLATEIARLYASEPDAEVIVV